MRYLMCLIGTSLLVAFIVPFWFVGFIAGSVWVALKQGWKEGNDDFA